MVYKRDEPKDGQEAQEAYLFHLLFKVRPSVMRESQGGQPCKAFALKLRTASLKLPSCIC